MLDYRPTAFFVNRSYWPDAEATGQLLTDLTVSMADQWNVEVLVGQPNRNPTGEAFLDRGVEVRQEVAIRRARHLQLPKRSAPGRMANLISFTRQVSRELKRLPHTPDVIVAETDPFFLPIVAARFARRRKCRFVAYLQDIYPDIAVALGKAKEGMIVRRIRSSLLAAYRQADRVVVLDEDMKTRLIGWGVPESKLRIVPNWVDTASLGPVKERNPFRAEHRLDDRFVVMHSGNMGLSQRLSVLLESLCDAQVDRSVLGLIVGDGADRLRLQQWVRERQADERVRFLDYQPRERLSESLSAADLQVISMDAAITGCLAPSKLYGILASATPILAIVPPGSDVWRLVEQHRLGWVATPGNVREIAERIEQARRTDPAERRAMGERGRQLAIERFDARRCIDQFEQVLREVVADPSTSGGSA